MEKAFNERAGDFMLTLGIETSCDETSCAVLKNGGQILSNIVSSSLAKHRPFGGIVPEIASRHCLEQINLVFETALREAKVSKGKINLIAVTRGPGLVGSLLVGLSFAKALAYQLKVPFIGVNHLEAHLAANFINDSAPRTRIVGLIVSGGHTEITYHQKGSVKILGSTVDDAVGEAYDKTAKILGLGYPGGPAVDRLAQKGNPKAFRFTKPKQDGRFDFSFSGIKTAVANLIQDVGAGLRARPKRKQDRHPGQPRGVAPTAQDSDFIENLCASFQETVAHWLVQKTIDACRLKKVKDVVVGGGVSANSRLRSLLVEEAKPYGIRVGFPPLSLTMDNAAMIARRGYELYHKGKRSDFKISARPNLRIGEK